MSARPGCGAGADGDRSQVSSAAADETFSASSGQALGRTARDWNWSSYMPTKRGKMPACGPTNGGIEREFSKKSRLAGRHKTVKAGLEAYSKCSRHCETRRFQAHFAHFCTNYARFLHAFSTRGTGIRDQGSGRRGGREFSAPLRASFRQAQGRHRSARRAIGIGRPICLQKERKCGPAGLQTGDRARTRKKVALQVIIKL